VAGSRVTDIVEQMALPIVEAAGLELVDVEFKKEGANWFLRVYIDKPEGVDIDDCSRVSEQLSDLLDETDPIPNAYFLEVSSPGAERPLKKPADFEKAVGEFIHIKLYQALDKQKEFDGRLEAYDGDSLTLSYRQKGVQKHLVLKAEQVASARLAIEF
jgi:ribosome maturation factor RimP